MAEDEKKSKGVRSPNGIAGEELFISEEDVESVVSTGGGSQWDTGKLQDLINNAKTKSKSSGKSVYIPISKIASLYHGSAKEENLNSTYSKKVREYFEGETHRVKFAKVKTKSQGEVEAFQILPPT